MSRYTLVYQAETDGEIELETIIDGTAKVLERIEELAAQGVTEYDYAIIGPLGIIKDFNKIYRGRGMPKIMEDEYPTVTLPRSEGSLDDPGEYCCAFSKHQLDGHCRGPEGHVTDTTQCPDQVLCYNAKLREYSLSAVSSPNYTATYCSSCGTKFPTGLRDEWFNLIEGMGLDPWEDRDMIPEEFKSDAWWKARGL
jgi:hypothetical protein